MIIDENVIFVVKNFLENPAFLTKNSFLSDRTNTKLNGLKHLVKIRNENCFFKQL